MSEDFHTPEAHRRTVRKMKGEMRIVVTPSTFNIKVAPTKETEWDLLTALTETWMAFTETEKQREARKLAFSDAKIEAFVLTTTP